MLSLISTLCLSIAVVSPAPSAVHLRVLAGRPVDPYLFGYNAEAYIGITLNKLLNDTAGLAAAKALHVGAFRYPGGTLSNTWNPMTGQYVEPSPFPGGYPDGYNKWQVWGKRLNKDYPKGTFTAGQYLAKGNLGSVTKRTLWCINVYSFNASEACAQIAYIASLPGQQEPGVLLELGNEVYIRDQGLPRFPNASSYAEQMAPVVRCARRLMPKARVAAVGAPGTWNKGLREYAHLFDAVSWHAYEPHGYEVAKLPSLADQVSFVAGYSRARAALAVAQLQEDLGTALPLVHTEFGYGLDRPGACVLDPLLNGAVHGAFHVARILAAINNPGTFAAVLLESFVGGTPAAGPNVPVDPQAGNRSDYWCGLAATTVDVAHANRADLARVAGTGQLFSHVAATAFRSDTLHMHPVSVENGPKLLFPILGQAGQPCLQAAAFSEPEPLSATPAFRPDGGPILLSLSVLNICNQSIPATLRVQGARIAYTTLYSLLDAGPADPGPLHQTGWVPLPGYPDSLPWKSGPLRPHNVSVPVGVDGQLTVVFRALTVAVVDIGS